MALASGNLRHHVEIQKPQTDQDPVTGEMLVTWVPVARTLAEIVPVSVRAFTAAAAQQSEVRGHIVIRQRRNIDATMRIVYRGLAYQILGVLADPQSGLEYLTLPVAEGVRVA